MFLLVSLSRAGCYFYAATGIAVVFRANGFHWTICTIFFMTDWLCPSSTAHFSIPFYITSHSHNSTLMMQYVPLNHRYLSTKQQHTITHTSIYDYHFLAVYCAHNSLYRTALLLRKNPEHYFTRGQVESTANLDITPKAGIHAPSTKWTLVIHPLVTLLVHSAILTDMIHLYHTNAYLKSIRFPWILGRLPVKSHTSTLSHPVSYVH